MVWLVEFLMCNLPVAVQIIQPSLYLIVNGFGLYIIGVQCRAIGGMVLEVNQAVKGNQSLNRVPGGID